MSDYIDYDRFYGHLEANACHLKLGVLAKEMGVTVPTLGGLLDGESRKGFFEINIPVYSAFFMACNWLGVEPNTFLTEGHDKDYPSDRVYRLNTGQICHIFQCELKWRSVRVLMQDNPGEAYDYIRYGVRYEELEILSVEEGVTH